MINLDFLHSLGFTGSDISVGVFDAGFRNVDTMEGFYRLRSSGNIKYTYDFVDRTENLFNYTFWFSKTIWFKQKINNKEACRVLFYFAIQII